MKRPLLSSFFMFLFVSLTWGQSRIVKGTITDDVGEAIPGANILIKGTMTGTTSDIDGNYQINVSTENPVLIISFVGFETKEVSVGAKSVLDVSLMSTVTSLAEVVVVGYGTRSKESLTGSVALLGEKKIRQVPTASFQDALQGNMPGRQVTANDGAPGAGISIRVRGIGSINASNEPLYVIDGLPVTSSSTEVSTTDFDNGGRSANLLASINPNDIESLVVLKDAASTAIYGSRGANGVVLITTKSGQKGKPKIDFNTQFGFSTFAFNNLLEPLNEAQYRQLYVEGKIGAGDLETEEDALALYAQQFPEQADTDWLDEMTQTGFTEQYDLSVSGGNDNLKYFISGSYYGQEGTVVNNYFDRYSSRVNISGKISEKLTIANNLNLTYFNQRGITDGTRWQAPFYLAYLMSPAVPVLDDQGRYYGEHTFFMGANNPVGHLNEDKREREQSRIINNFSLSYKILEGLTFKSAWSFDILSVDDYIFSNGRYGDGRNIGGSAQEATVDQLNWLGTQTLTYNTTIQEKHGLEVLLGYEAQKVTTDQVDAYGEGFSHPELRTLSSAANPVAQTFFSRTAYSFLSYFSQLNYDFNQKYFASFSLRRDGSSKFGPDARWGSFWSIGGSYVLSEEPIFQNISMINYLKLRVSYGIVGNAGLNDNIAATDNNFLWSRAYGFDRAYDGNPAAAPNTIGNPVLTWESQENLNFGLDFTGFDNRVNATIEYFIRTSSDLLLNKPLSRTTGFRNIIDNVGDMENKGLEISLSGDVISTSDFTLNLGGNIAFLSNEITRLDEAILDGTKRREEGRDFQEYYLYGWAGVNPENGDPLWYTDESETETTSDINEAVRYYDGKSATPDFYGGFNLSASFKSFTLSAQLNYQFGNYVYDNPGWVIHGDGRFTPRSTSTWAFENRWTTPGQEALFPRHYWGNTASALQDNSRYLFEGDFIRLRTVSLAYNLPNTLIQRANLRNVQVSVLFNNFLTWVKDEHLHFDPEQTINGIYNTVTPISKTVTFALNVGL